LTQRHSDIFSSVNDSFQSGQVSEGTLGSLERFERREDLVSDPRNKAVLHLRGEDEALLSVDAQEQTGLHYSGLMKAGCTRF
jgi:hypothetical protein